MSWNKITAIDTAEHEKWKLIENFIWVVKDGGGGSFTVAKSDDVDSAHLDEIPCNTLGNNTHMLQSNVPM